MDLLKDFMNMFSSGKSDPFWKSKPPSSFNELSSFEQNQIEKCSIIPKPQKVNLNEVMELSEKFQMKDCYKFPTDTCRIKSQPKERFNDIQLQADGVRPVLHERAVWLFIDFLEYKIHHGTEEEKKLYKDMTICDLVQRLLAKRCVEFYGNSDYYTCLDGSTGKELYLEPNLSLDKCLTRDEVKLSALLSISSHSEFLNDGNRFNNGIIEEDKSKIETEGVIISLVGPRFQRPFEMDYQDIVIEEFQNKIENGFGASPPYDESKEKAYRNIWNKFHDDKDFIYDEAMEIFSKNRNSRFVEKKEYNLDSKILVDEITMKKRFSISFDTLLLEAESRAAAANKMAYIHVVGIGVGSWKYHEYQEYHFMESFGNRIEELKDQLKHVGFIDFSYFKTSRCNGLKNGDLFKIENHPNGGIKLFFSRRNPNEKLDPVKFPNCIMVVSYAGNGNSLPGNDFWTSQGTGYYSNTSDPAAALCTLISELHTTHINPYTCCGNNLYVATLEHGVIHISDFAKIVINNN